MCDRGKSAESMPNGNHEIDTAEQKCGENAVFCCINTLRVCLRCHSVWLIKNWISFQMVILSGVALLHSELILLLVERATIETITWALVYFTHLPNHLTPTSNRTSVRVPYEPRTSSREKKLFIFPIRVHINLKNKKKNSWSEIIFSVV